MVNGCNCSSYGTIQIYSMWKVDTPCDGSHIKEKWAYHHIMHEHTPQLSLMTIIKMLTGHMQVFNTPHLNIMAVNMPRHLESGTFIRE
jgi:hypothetical protein